MSEVNTTTPDRQIIENAVENAELMIEESIAEIRKLDTGRYGEDEFSYDHGYHQGRKDACRVLLTGLRASADEPVEVER